MMPLDRPVWSSLTTAHLHLSEGGPLARRYPRDIGLFAAARDDGAAALEALGELVRPGEWAFLLQAQPIVPPPGLTVEKRALAVQMVDGGRGLSEEVGTDGTGPAAGADGAGGRAPAGIVPLGPADYPEMRALAALTDPGPFLDRTPELGSFFGIRIDGRLAAMAGERLRFPGHTEVSGVCTHPDHRGHGHARRLSARVMAAIRARGDRPFLHAWADRPATIRLYERLGFHLRSDMHVAVVGRG